MAEATVNTEEWALRLNKELTEARTRIAALEAQLAEVRRKLQERADWHRCSCPHPCDDYNVFPGGCSGKYRQDYQSVLSALEATPPARKEPESVRRARKAIFQDQDGLATPPAPKVTDAMVDAGLQHYSEGGCSGLADYERREVVQSIIEAALTAAQESGE